MKLIVMAHKGEAKFFLSRLPSQTKLILTGTGIEKAQEKLSSFLKESEEFPIKTLINLGFAGSLHPDLKEGSLVQVQNVTYRGNKIDLNSPKLLPLPLVSCESLDEPLLILRTPAEKPLIVDQELYGIIQTIKSSLFSPSPSLSMRVYSFKIISDEPYARNFDKDEFMRKIPMFSQKLFDYYKNDIEKNI